MSTPLEPLHDALFAPLVADEQITLLGGRTVERPPFFTRGITLTQVGPTVILDGVMLPGRQIADETSDTIG